MFDAQIPAVMQRETKSLVFLLKSQNPEVLQATLKELMFAGTPAAVESFLSQENLRLLMELCSSPHKNVETNALRLLWHLSAQAEMKVILYEEGILNRIKAVMLKEDPEDFLACAAVLQNICEYKFCRGSVNPNQVKLVNEGILDLLKSRINAEDKRVQFLTCLSICNLSMNEENHKKIEKSGLLATVQRFVTEHQLHVDMVCHWLTLQPHIPLLHSAYYEVKLFSLSCLLTLVRNDHYKMEVWRTLALNDGVQILLQLSKGTNTTLSQLASLVISALQIEEPVVTKTECGVGDYLSKMFNNPEFSDVKFVCEGGVIYGHKAILASRCPLFHAMFTRFRESTENEIRIPEETMGYETLRITIEFAYSGSVRGVNHHNALDVLAAAEMWGLPELKTHCEFVLWNYIDCENAAHLYCAAAQHRAPQLLRACVDFATRNLAHILRSEGYAGLPAEVKEELKEGVTRARENKDKKEVDAQGKKMEEKGERRDVDQRLEVAN